MLFDHPVLFFLAHLGAFVVLKDLLSLAGYTVFGKEEALVNIDREIKTDTYMFLLLGDRMGRYVLDQVMSSRLTDYIKARINYFS